MKALRKFGPLRSRFMVKPLPPMLPLAPVKTEAEQGALTEAKIQGWIEKVGESRARSAATLAEEKTGSTTLPELLTEIYLRDKGARYRTQFDFGFARPDFIVFDTPGVPASAAVWAVQGDYFHGTDAAVVRDAAQKEMLLTQQAEGSPIAAVIALWESNIYQGDDVLDAAYYNGEEQARVGV